MTTARTKPSEGFDEPATTDNGREALEREALELHARAPRGKIEVTPTKPLVTQRDLSLAYSPGVAAPCLAIRNDPELAYAYTAKGNLVAVISNGTAVLGLGNLGPLGAKPVMEGKAVLFKRFADIDAVDLEFDTEEVDAFVDAVRIAAPTFGGINLEDIKAPECFIIEQRLRELLDIPVFHDDQHGTAIITAAALINALDLTGRTLKDARLVVNGAGAAAIACLDLLKAMGLPHGNATLCDTRGVIHKGREAGMNQWKSAHAIETDARTLEEAMEGADVFLGLSARGAVTKGMAASMARNPIVFAMANPDPEITPEDVRDVRDDAIIATGRSDYPNQVNNVLGFPYIFRGALDVQASTINDAMKVAAAHAIAALAREEVPDEVSLAYRTRALRYGPTYLIPTPFDPRLMTEVPAAVAQAAHESGVARRPIADLAAYKDTLRARLSPTASRMQQIIDRVRANPKKVVFAEGEEEKTIRAALAWRNNRLGVPVLVGREDEIRATLARIGIGDADGLEIVNARLAEGHGAVYAEFLYRRLHRRGQLARDCQRLVHTDRNVFAACMVALGDADAMVTGLTRPYRSSLDDVLRVFDAKPGEQVFGLTIMLTHGGRTVFLADTSVHEEPEPETLADIACQAARRVRALGHDPRVALLSFSTFGDRVTRASARVRAVTEALDRRHVDFAYDGEISARVALDPELLKLYPFSRLKGPANVLVLPSLHSAHIGAIMLQELGGCTAIGPLLQGLAKPVQIVPMNATVSDILNMAAVAGLEAIEEVEAAVTTPAG